MNGPPWVFSGRLSENDVGNIQWYQDLLKFRRSSRWMAVLSLTILGGVVNWWLFAFDRAVAIAAIILNGFIWVYLVIVIPQERKRAARRFYRANEQVYLESRVTLTNDRVTTDNEVHSASFQWQLIGLVVDTPKGLLFCTQTRQTIFWLPHRLFDDDTLRDRLLEFVNDRGVPIQRLS